MLNPSAEAQPGDILFGENNLNQPGVRPHFIIFLDPDPANAGMFLGAMLTHSPRFKNISLEEDHFEKNDEHGNPWQVQFEKSFIAGDLYHKKEEWRPFTKVGQLSKAGLDFVRQSIGGKNPVFSPLNKD